MFYKYVFNAQDIFFHIDDKVCYDYIKRIIPLQDFEEKYYNEYSQIISIVNNGDNYLVSLKLLGNTVYSKNTSLKESVLLVIEILNYIINENKNTISFHASGFYYKNNVFLFMNKSGSGKTTALLSGLKYLDNCLYFGDDRILIDNDLNIYGCLIALSIKKGTISLFKLNHKDLLGPYLKDGVTEYWYYTIDKGYYYVDTLCCSSTPVHFIIIEYMDGKKLYWKDFRDNKISQLIKNCYNIKSNTRQCYEIIRKMAKKIKMYYISYSKIYDLLQWVEKRSQENERK